MRTTVDIPLELLRAAKEQAARRGASLSGIVEEALRAHLESMHRYEALPFELIVAGEAGGRSPSAADVHRLLDDDEGRPPR